MRVECGRRDSWPNCAPLIQIGPGVGVAQVKVIGTSPVPESDRGYFNRVLSMVSLECTLGAVKFDVRTGTVRLETSILFVNGTLRPEDVLFAFGCMGNFMQMIMDELWEFLNWKKWIKHVQEALVERARKLVPYEVGKDE